MPRTDPMDSQRSAAVLPIVSVFGFALYERKTKHKNRLVLGFAALRAAKPNTIEKERTAAPERRREAAEGKKLTA